MSELSAEERQRIRGQAEEHAPESGVEGDHDEMFLALLDALEAAEDQRDEAQAEAGRLREGLRNPLLRCSECEYHRNRPGSSLPGHRCPEEARAALEAPR